jgi:hypothetical protein
LFEPPSLDAARWVRSTVGLECAGASSGSPRLSSAPVSRRPSARRRRGLSVGGIRRLPRSRGVPVRLGVSSSVQRGVLQESVGNAHMRPCRRLAAARRGVQDANPDSFRRASAGGVATRVGARVLASISRACVAPSVLGVSEMCASRRLSGADGYPPRRRLGLEWPSPQLHRQVGLPVFAPAPAGRFASSSAPNRQRGDSLVRIGIGAGLTAPTGATVRATVLRFIAGGVLWGASAASSAVRPH